MEPLALGLNFTDLTVLILCTVFFVIGLLSTLRD